VTEKELREKIDSLCFMLGVSTSIIQELKRYKPKDVQNHGIKWLFEAMECVIYKNMPMPLFSLEGGKNE